MHEANAGRRPPGELEASVLAALWAADGRALTPADVQRELGTDLARTTVTTILTRLHEKGSVSRTRSGRGYAYLPAADSPGLAARRMRTELDKSAQDDRGTVLARFVSELGPADERLLRELLAQADTPEGGAGAREDGRPATDDRFAGERGAGKGADSGAAEPSSPRPPSADGSSAPGTVG